MFEVTFTATLRFEDLGPDALDQLADVVMDALCERSENGSTSVDHNLGTLEIETIVRTDDIAIGEVIAQRIVRDAAAQAGVPLLPDLAVESVHSELVA
jgi:hypothetical protein